MSDNVNMTMTIDGIDYQVELNQYHRFSVSLGEGYAGTEAAETWDDLETRLTRRVRKSRVRVNVPFVTEDGKPGTAYQIHAGSQNPLIEWADGTKGQGDPSYVLRPDTDVAELRRLIKAVSAAERALRQFRSDHRLPTMPGATREEHFRLSDYVKDAVMAAQREAAGKAEAQAATNGVEVVDLDA